MSDNIQRGKMAALKLINDIVMENDTDKWESDDFQSAIEDKLDYEKYYDLDGMRELCDILAFLLDAYSDEAEFEARSGVARYGIAYALGRAVGDANVLGESCYLFN